jgi:carboxylate-amine ligase
VHFPGDRYRLIADEMRGLQARTPTCALHVHVGMPDAEAAIRAFNEMRSHLPLLQALAANSPFWYGRDSGLASARAQVFRALPRSEIPPAFSSFDEYAECTEALVAAGGMPNYTFVWWDIRPHPILGTLEIRAMDSQSSLGNAAGLAALVHSLARMAVEEHGPWEHREVLMESSFRAARDGLDATLWHDGALRPVPEIARATVERARPYARELGSEGALEEIERILIEGNGAARQRAAFASGGMTEVLAELVEETARGGRAVASATGHHRHDG